MTEYAWSRVRDARTEKFEKGDRIVVRRIWENPYQVETMMFDVDRVEHGSMDDIEKIFGKRTEVDLGGVLGEDEIIVWKLVPEPHDGYAIVIKRLRDGRPVATFVREAMDTITWRQAPWLHAREEGDNGSAWCALGPELSPYTLEVVFHEKA